MVEADTDSADADTPITSRVSPAEQSNTSVIFNDRLILKLFRKLNAGGENPDVEICRFLSTVAGYTHIPAYRGSLSGPDGSTLAFAQDFVPNHGDGWQWLTTELTRLFAQPAFPSSSASFLSSRSKAEGSAFSATGADDHPTLAAATLLGTRTAEMHLGLAHPTEDPAFRAEAFTPNDLASDAARLQAQADSTFAALKSALGKLPPALTPDAAALLARRSVITEQAQALATASPFRFGRRIRIHGDFHLGQTLRTDNDFLLVDFEGEPARPLDIRRRKQSPLRDVAGMLRSFSYAAATALPPSPDDAADARAAAWLQAATHAFLDAYNAAVAPNPELVPQPEHRGLLLRAYLLEKALYELLYELNNRPTWIPIPLRGILALLESAA